MKHFKLIIILILVAIFNSTLIKAENKDAEYVRDEIIVKFKDSSKSSRQKEIDQFLTSMGAYIISTNSYSKAKRINIPINLTEYETLEILRDNPSVEYAHLNYICHAHTIPNDPFYFYQWNFELINMEKAWNIQAKGSENIVVAVLDTGIAYENYDNYSQAPDLRGTSFTNPYDFINYDYHANDDDGHGTHITGTICQSTNNSYGPAGMAYGTSIIPVKVLDYEGSGSVSSLVNGIIWAVLQGANIINMSLGFPPNVVAEDIPLVTEAIKYAYDNNVIIVASSGNEGVGIVSYPAAYPEVIAVGAVHSGDELAGYSQYGVNIELVAPGGDYTDRDGNGYMDGILQEIIDEPPDYNNFVFRFLIGTSMAAPHVSGLIALLLTQKSSRTITDIRNILHTTSIDLGEEGWDELYGYGRIDAYLAISYDKDGDGYSYKDDCNDIDSLVYPGAPELCDGKDNNCDGIVPAGETDDDEDGMSECEGDCDDNDPDRYPGNTEICDGKDNDCDGEIDEGFDTDGDGVSDCIDSDDDNDGISDIDEAICGSDPLDNDSTCEICDDIDNDLDGSIDEGLSKYIYYRDYDEDGYGNPYNTILDCSIPTGYVLDNTDCDDNDININPGVTEVCGNSIDDDCDGIIDCPSPGSSGGVCFISILPIIK